MMPRLPFMRTTLALALGFGIGLGVGMGLGVGPALADGGREAPMLAALVAEGKLPPLEQRLPAEPRVADFGPDQTPGEYGGTLHMLMARARDTRQMTVYAYARLVKYDRNLNLVPDILKAVDILDGGREFVLHLREGHRWSDGHPFTSADFRFWWEDVANNAEISPAGIPVELLAEGEAPSVSFPDDLTVIYRWSNPNPRFLPALAEPTPVYIFTPAHYMRQFHARYTPPEELAKRVEETSSRNWAQMHNTLGRARDSDNPDLPILEAWIPRTAGPADRFVFDRNPYFHRVDAAGRQLPYIDRVIFDITQSGLITGKAAAGEVDLQGRYLRFDQVTLLKSAEERHGFDTLLWRIAKGAHLALFPNLTVDDAGWRAVLRDVRFRRALSLAINRYELNRVIYFGLAIEGQNTMLPGSPLYDAERRQRWSGFDLDQANALLDEMGLTQRDRRGARLMPDGRPLEIIVETAGGTEEADVLSLISDSWAQIGVRMFIRPLSLDVMRNRIYGGRTVMSIGSGLENGLATPDIVPSEIAPVDQVQYQWAKWGQYFQTRGESGEPVDLPAAQDLLTLYKAWFAADTEAARARAWQAMLDIHADQVFSIGLVAGVYQPIVVTDGLANVPQEGIWNWNPGAHFGLFGMDRFYFTDPDRRAPASMPGQSG